MRSFDIAFLRSFVALADGGTMRHAGEQRARSTAAISQQMRALESLAGVTLLERSSGKVMLSAQGLALLPYAREIIRLNDEAMQALHCTGAQAVRFGMPQDFAASGLADALAAFAQAHPRVALQAQVERNSRIAGLLAEGQLDLALLIGQASANGGEAVARVPALWLARQGLALDTAAPVPLLLLEEPCLFREYALSALTRAGIAWRVAFTSPSVAGLWAAVSAGLGVTVRMPLGLPAGVAPLPAAALPALPHVRLSLHRRREPQPDAVQALFGIVADALLAAATPASQTACGTHLASRLPTV
ncbi:MAG: LysR substrate-binding domain-containing protein [Ramlibacter sp.]